MFIVAALLAVNLRNKMVGRYMQFSASRFPRVLGAKNFIKCQFFSNRLQIQFTIYSRFFL
jgi:hypothetical protein